MIRRALRQLALLLALAVVPAAISGFTQLKWQGNPDELQPDEVRPATARMWGDAVLWVDARSRKKYEEGHIPGAVLLNEEEWDACVAPFLDVWDPAKRIVVYCDGGQCDASQAVAERLRNDLQLGTVNILKGGWEAWQKQ